MSVVKERGTADNTFFEKSIRLTGKTNRSSVQKPGAVVA